MSIKTLFRKKLLEANYIVKPETLDQVVDKMDDTDTVKVVDESEDEHNGRISPISLDPEYERLSKVKEEVINPIMTKGDIQETVIKILNYGK